jgi:hypothetical protein
VCALSSVNHEPMTTKTYFIYHRVPANMEGTTLYPLNVLKDTHPDLYEKYSAAYAGREFVMDMKIVPLDARWNDALHLLAVDPADIKAASIEAGAKFNRMNFYRIDPSALDPKKTTVYRFDTFERRQKVAEDFSKYDPEHISDYSKVPEITKAYYRESALLHKDMNAFAGIPHILYMGPIDISHSEIIRL